MKYKTPISMILLVLIATMLSCSRKGPFEKEPNNSFSSANDTSPDSIIRGFIDSNSDRDYFIFEISRDSILDIELSGIKGVNLAMKVWRGDTRKLLKWIDDSRKSSPERMVNFHVEPGTYYIEVLHGDRDVKKSNKETPYELSIKSREPQFEETEDNDTRETADLITPGEEIAGYYSPGYNRLNTSKDSQHREEDWYFLDVTVESGTPSLADITVSGVTGINSILYLYGPEGEEITMADNGSNGDPEEIRGAGLTKSGKYYIVVAPQGYLSNNEEPYTLTVSLREHDPGAEMESNNDFDTANVIVNNIITGKINSREDTDYFLFRSDGAASTYRIELRVPDDMDGMVRIYSSERERIVEINNGGTGLREVYPNLYTKGMIYIAVSLKSGGIVPDEDYVLSVSDIGVSGVDEKEPNNDKSRATEISGNEITGFISSRGDKDYFSLSSENRVKRQFEIQGVRGGEIKVSVTDPLGYITKSVKVIGNRKVSLSEMIDRKGYIIVESIEENFDNPYIIKIRGDR